MFLNWAPEFKTQMRYTSYADVVTCEKSLMDQTAPESCIGRGEGRIHPLDLKVIKQLWF